LQHNPSQYLGEKLPSSSVSPLEVLYPSAIVSRFVPSLHTYLPHKTYGLLSYAFFQG